MNKGTGTGMGDQTWTGKRRGLRVGEWRSIVVRSTCHCAVCQESADACLDIKSFVRDTVYCISSVPVTLGRMIVTSNTGVPADAVYLLGMS